MTELKPCPFCGGEAWMRISDAPQILRIECRRCHAATTSFVADSIGEKEAAAAWNTRHVETCNAELANRYIELPLDADGVPIHIGDMLSSDEYRGRQFPCRGMSVGVRNGKYWTVCMDYDSYSGTSEWCAASRCHHVR